MERKKQMKRILLKLSGEALAGETGKGLNDEFLKKISLLIQEIHMQGVELALVVGGGNFWRGRSSGEMDRVTADHIGMLATTMNALALADALRQVKVPVKLLNSLPIFSLVEVYSALEGRKALESGQVLILGGGTGNPLFSTDSAAALRAIELNADYLIKATNVDGVYDRDPRKDPQAQLYNRLTQEEVLKNNLKVMDSAAAALCREFQMPAIVLNLNPLENLLKLLSGAEIGTVVEP